MNERQKKYIAKIMSNTKALRKKSEELKKDVERIKEEVYSKKRLNF